MLFFLGITIFLVLVLLAVDKCHLLRPSHLSVKVNTRGDININEQLGYGKP